MHVKQYLSQIRKLNIQISQLIEERDFLYGQLTSTSARLKDVQVMSSVPEDPMGDRIARIVELEHELDDKIDRLIDVRETIVRQIYELDNPLYVQVLYKRYVEAKKWEQIEEEMNYSYQHLQRAHVKAIRTFSYVHNIR